MQNLISTQNISVTTGHGALFRDLCCSLTSESRVGLVGANGAGKSTLLRILAKIESPEDGEVIHKRGLRVEYVPQFVPTELRSATLFEAVVAKLESASPPRQEWEAYDHLIKFGFQDQDFGSLLGNLSGGEANRALLACAVACTPDFLLLDEPTNHMDSESIDWFEEFMQNEISIPFCVVSHDRDLLDACTNETFFLRDQRIYHFRTPYSQAVEELRGHDEALRKRRADQEKEIDRLDESTRQLQAWAKLSDKMSSRLRAMRTRVVRLESDLVAVPKQPKAEISVSQSELNAKSALVIKNLAVKVGESRLLFDVERFSIAPGERIAILGRNGTGKTSFLKTLVRNFPEPMTDAIRFNPQVTFGYYDQELRSLNPTDSMLQYLLRTPSVREDKVRGELVKAGFGYLRHGQKVQTLSGGERARLQFLALKLQGPTLLLLDEPTNHIDVDGIQNLEYHLSTSPAACIFVSHDRRFLRNVAKRFFLIQAGHLCEIDDLDRYYDSLLGHATKPTAMKIPSAPSPIASKGIVGAVESFESVSAEIEQLEKNLETGAERESKLIGLYQKLEKYL